jgi:hypothetical protein
VSDRWRHIEDLFHRALEREEGDRAAFLREACAGDESLRIGSRNAAKTDLFSRLFQILNLSGAGRSSVPISAPIESSHSLVRAVWPRYFSPRIRGCGGRLP